MAKERLTITLDTQLLEQIDGLIDGSSIRNRSHAIEVLLRQSVLPPISKTIILAEGSKGLPMFKEKPVLAYTIELLKRYGLNNIVIATSSQSHAVEEYLKDGSAFGVSIEYSKEKEPLGTAGAVKHAEPLVTGENFLVVHGDILFEMDLFPFLTFYQSHDPIALLALTSVREPASFGVVKLQGNRIVKFIEKPQQKQTSHFISAGIYLFHRDIFQYIPQSRSSLEKEIFPLLAKENKLIGYPFTGAWFDVSLPEMYDRASSEWEEFTVL